MMTIRCSVCGWIMPQGSTAYCCPRCGGVLDYDSEPTFSFDLVDPKAQGIWRYRATFGLPDGLTPASLGEGGTPLVSDKVDGVQVYYKLEMLNPTGSFKDRATAPLVSYLKWAGAGQVIEDSSGNAGASLAAYCARAGMKARIFVPATASGPKLEQIAAYGAELVTVRGPRSEAASAARAEAEAGAVYASHAFTPYGLMGLATMAYELYEQLGRAPGTVVAPVGQGTLLLGLIRGFRAIAAAGLIRQSPFYVGVQARACAPIWTAFRQGVEAAERIEEGATVAEGVRVSRPARLRTVLEEIRAQEGTVVAIAEEDILPAQRKLARSGFYVEPTSALVFAALESVGKDLRPPIVAVLTGNGLKYQPEGQ